MAQCGNACTVGSIEPKLNEIKVKGFHMGYAQAKLTGSEYLAWEASQAERHMFVAGEVFSMAGGTAEHNRSAFKAAMALERHLAGTPCKTFIGDMRLKVQAADAYFYPDVVVTCDTVDISDPKISTIVAPKLVIEVLSPSTVAYDRGQKFAAYRTLPSLQEYVLIDPESKTLEVFRKNTAGIWELHPSTDLTTNLRFESVDLTIKLEAFFE